MGQRERETATVRETDRDRQIEGQTDRERTDIERADRETNIDRQRNNKQLVK